jgi:alkyl hydroperoxide reductase subunit AhpC
MSRPIFTAAPDFTADSTHGPFRLSGWQAGRWCVMWWSPFAFTPVCTTELAEFARRFAEFDRRGVGVAHLSADETGNLQRWVADVAVVFGTDVPFPLIADHDRSIARAYGLFLPEQEEDFLPVQPGRWMRDTPDFGLRGLFVLSPGGSVAASLTYPPNVGYPVDEVLRILDALRLSRYKLAAPSGWRQGDDVVVGRVLSDEDATARFGALKTLTPYLRTARQPPYASPASDTAQGSAAASDDNATRPA